MPRLITTTLQSAPGKVIVRVRQWQLPEHPYPVHLAGAEVPVVGAWGTTVEKLRGVAEALNMLADLLEAERE